MSSADRLARRVVAAGITLIALIVIAEVHEAWQDHRTALRDNQRIQQALGRVLAEQTARMLQETDVVLSDYGAWVLSTEGRQADAELRRERLRADVMRLPFVYSATLASPDGRVLATSRSDSREVVEVPANALKDSLYIGKPFDGARDEARTFALSRPITAPEFSGIVVARVAFEYLTGFYASVDATPDTSIRLLRDDGVILAQYPREGAAAALPRKSRDEVAVTRTVEGYPVIVEVTRPLSSILRPWVRDELNSAARTLVLVALAVALLVALRAALLRHAAQEQERRRLEQDLEVARRMDALGFLAASVAHDFNNVLSAIVGYGELARKSLPADSEEVANVDRLLAAADRARLLVRRVLTFDPRRGVEYAPLPLTPILIEVTQQIEASLPSSVTLRTRGLDAPACVRGDGTEVHQIVMNLATNAVHAMPAGGRLEIELEHVVQRQERALTLGKLLPGDWVRLTIADTGVGLSAAQIDAVFEPFYTTRGSELGTGIGLTVVRTLLTRMQGALDVQSQKGSGTRISVYWPSTQPDAIDAGSPRAQSPGKGETVMIVDDKPELVNLAEDVLASLGYEPVGFTDARLALKAFRSQPRRFDALVTDERMRSLGGCELAKKIHSIDARFPVILVTGYRDADLLLRAKEAGVAEILDKPLNARVLGDALSRQLALANRDAPPT